MILVNTFIADDDIQIPHYTYYSLKMFRELNPDVEMWFICPNNLGGFGKIFDDLNIHPIPMDMVETTYELETLWNMKDKLVHMMGKPNTRHPSPPQFFFRALERIFYLHSVVENAQLENVYHTENDVLTYMPLNKIHHGLNKEGYVTDIGPNISTFAFCKFRSADILERICHKFLKFIWYGEDVFKKYYNVDMMNEMTMLAQCHDFVNRLNYYLDPVCLFNEQITPVFDGASFGQYLGGTNNEYGPGYAGSHHYKGKEILEGKISVFMDKGRPFVKNEFKTNPIFNLHLHAKNLKEFYDDYKLHNG